MNHVLAAIDFSPASTAVAQHAALVAARTGARLTLLHVQPPLSEESVEALMYLSVLQASRRLNALAQSLRESYAADLPVATKVLETTPGPGIVAAARELEADLVVMGQTRNRGLWRFLLGDVTGRVIDSTPVPVLVVPANCPVELPRELVLAAGDHLPGERAFAPLRELIRAFDVELEILHILERDGRQHGPQLEQLVEGYSWRYLTQGKGKGVSNHLCELGGPAAHRWLCLTHRHRAPFARAMLRGLSNEVAAKTPVPVLILVEPGAAKGQPQPRAVGRVPNPAAGFYPGRDSRDYARYR